MLEPAVNSALITRMRVRPGVAVAGTGNDTGTIDAGTQLMFESVPLFQTISPASVNKPFWFQSIKIAAPEV